MILRDLAAYRPQYKDDLINTLIWNCLVVFVFAYIMPEVGLNNFGTFILITNIASIGFFSTTEKIGSIVSDLEGDKAISYYLTLPIPQWLVFVQMAIANAMQAVSIAIVAFPIGLLILGDIHALPHFCWWKFAIMLVVSSIFYGFFSLVAAAFTKNIYSMNNTWLRVIFPLWHLGGNMYPWKEMHNVSPIFANILLANPIMYCLEGTRATTLAPELSLSFWTCVLTLLSFTALMAYVGISKFLKRLDCL
jgi:ABC-2 type transport system permease protein